MFLLLVTNMYVVMQIKQCLISNSLPNVYQLILRTHLKVNNFKPSTESKTDTKLYNNDAISILMLLILL